MGLCLTSARLLERSEGRDFLSPHSEAVSEESNPLFRSPNVSNFFLVAISQGKHLIPFRTQQLSPVEPMILSLMGK